MRVVGGYLSGQGLKYPAPEIVSSS